MGIYDLLVYKVKAPICITLNKCFFKIMGCPFLGGVVDGKKQKGTWGVKKFFLQGTSLMNAC